MSEQLRSNEGSEFFTGDYGIKSVTQKEHLLPEIELDSVSHALAVVIPVGPDIEVTDDDVKDVYTYYLGVYIPSEHYHRAGYRYIKDSHSVYVPAHTRVIARGCYGPFDEVAVPAALVSADQYGKGMIEELIDTNRALDTAPTIEGM